MSGEKRQLEEMTDSEEETMEVLSVRKEISMATMMDKILQSNPPLSQEQPGYLLGFVNMLDGEQNLPSELENSLRGFRTMGKIWSYNTTKAIKKGVIEYLESCKGLTGILFATSFDLKTLERLKILLAVYVETNTTAEDCCRLVEKLHMSTSATTVRGVTVRAGAAGTKKPKLSEHTTDEISVDIDEIPVEIEPQPTFKTYSCITAPKEGKSYTKRLEDSWKGYHAKVTIYRRSDLMNCPKSADKWKYKYQEMELNYESGGQISQMMNQMKGAQMNYLSAKGANWELKKEYKFE
uniref:NS2 n=1 Tax=uncultured densovirus TaxID=748192 RepID=A0A7L7YQF2_9VIRU|nr:NS2 [uncultured densovirus]